MMYVDVFASDYVVRFFDVDFQQSCWNKTSTWFWEGTTTCCGLQGCPNPQYVAGSVKCFCWATPMYLIVHRNKSFCFKIDGTKPVFFCCIDAGVQKSSFCSQWKTPNHYKYPLLNKNGWTVPHESTWITVGKGQSSPLPGQNNNHQLEQAEVAAVRQKLQERPPRPRAKLIHIGPLRAISLVVFYMEPPVAKDLKQIIV